MKYYNLESFTYIDPKYLLGSLIPDIDDRLLLSVIYWYCKEVQKDLVFVFALRQFYKNFKGNRLEWLKHTVSIVYAFADIRTNSYLASEIALIKNKEELTPEIFLTRHHDKIVNRKGTIKSVMQELANMNDCPFAYSYLDRIRKEMIITYR